LNANIFGLFVKKLRGKKQQAQIFFAKQKLHDVFNN